MIDKSKTRNSSIELLRMLAMCGIIVLHYNDGKAFIYAQTDSVKTGILYLLESVAICGVDLFVLISGYFLSKTQKRSILKPLELLVQVSIFSTGFYLLKSVVKHDFSILRFLKALIPSNYFVILYIVLYLLSPYINKLLKQLNHKQAKQFIVLLLCIFSFWTVLVDLSEEILGFEWFGLSTIAAWGSQRGFNIVNFMLMYIIGAYFQYYGVPQKLKKRSLDLGIWVIVVCAIFLWAIWNRGMTLLELRSAWVYHNPLVIFSAVLLFLLFQQIKFYSKIINNLASAAFTSFLVHVKVIGFMGIQVAVESSVVAMLTHLFLTVAGLYLSSWVIHKCYHFCADWIFRQLARQEVFQEKIVV